MTTEKKPLAEEALAEEVVAPEAAAPEVVAPKIAAPEATGLRSGTGRVLGPQECDPRVAAKA